MNNVGPLQNVPNDPAIVQVREWKVCASLGNQKYCHCTKYRYNNSYANGGEFYLDIIAALVADFSFVSWRNSISGEFYWGARMLEFF